MKNEDKISGIVKSNPLKELEDGANINIKARYIYPTPPSGINAVDNWETFEGVVLSLSYVNSLKGINIVDGSAVVVAPGIAICATHLIEEYRKRIKEGLLSPICYGLRNNELLIWKIERIISIPNTDLSILTKQLSSKVPNDQTFYQASITTRTPEINEEVLICGFKPNHKLNNYKKSIGSTVEKAMYVSKGLITNSFPLKRDISMIPWPSVEINSLAHGGMSGGPVFDKFGRLFGIVSSSIEFGENDGNTYVSLIWPCLTTNFSAFWPKGLHQNNSCLLDSKTCFIDKKEAVSLVWKKKLGKHVTGYTMWTN